MVMCERRPREKFKKDMETGNAAKSGETTNTFQDNSQVRKSNISITLLVANILKVLLLKCSV